MINKSKLKFAAWSVVIILFLFLPWPTLILCGMFLIWKKMRRDKKTLGEIVMSFNFKLSYITFIAAMIILPGIPIHIPLLVALIFIVYKTWKDNRDLAPELLKSISNASLILHLTFSILLMLPFIGLAYLCHVIILETVFNGTSWISTKLNEFDQLINENLISGWLLGDLTDALIRLIGLVTNFIKGLVQLIYISLYLLLGFASVKFVANVIFRIVIMNDSFPKFTLQTAPK